MVGKTGLFAKVINTGEKWGDCMREVLGKARGWPTAFGEVSLW